jgi:hypothetical protein
MKTKFILTTCLNAIILFGSANAQSGFDAFWAKFKAAVSSDDKAAVASMTEFPFSTGYDPSSKKGEGYIKTRASFLRQFKHIFNDETDAVKCFKGATPEKEGKGYAVTCSFRQEPPGSEKPFVYSFKLTKLGWRFAGFENINE